MKIKDCKAIVTGGASGLGGACVKKLVEGGGRAAILDLDAARGEKLAAESGGSLIFVRTDVVGEQDVLSAIAKAVEAFGAINTVINCAGVGDPGKVLSKKGPLPLAAFERIVRINLVGTFNVTRLAVAQMVNNSYNDEGERGVIINTASVAAFDGQIGQAAYAASKAAIAGMTLPIARECAAYAIRVMTIAPGIFDTPLLASLPEAARDALGKMAPFPSRLGRPDEFAALVGHILENSMLNGEVIRLDGALRMAPK
ncbi:MAG: SDR family NAD(P)-dependent oxidoreductase [Syntrophobacteraceae bacterium]|nr:SDR family NAD(P)-dependent oxidoreductase [Syntrophobacteraceae bacterium]